MANGKDTIETELDRLDAEDGGNSGPGNLRRFLPATLAIVTVGVFAGVVWYAYSTGIREGSEFAAPLLEAIGPSKIAPQDPGGRDIPDQDKQVYGAIDRSDTVAKVERLLPPPENPLPLPLPVAPAPAAPPPVAEPQLEVPETPPVLASPPPPPSITGPLESPGSAETPPTQADTANSPEPETQSLVPPKPAALPVPDPAPSPAVEQEPAPVAAPQPVAPPKPEPVAPAPAAPAAPAPVADNFRIQLASLRTADAAKIAWEKRTKEAGQLLADLRLFVSEVEIPGKGTFFRAQGGPFADKELAQKVCDALKEKKIGCFVVKR